MESSSPAEDSTAAMELARNLPSLVAQLKALREDMERKSKLYDSLLQQVQDPSASINATVNAQSPPSAPLDMSQSGMRGSIFTPFSNSQLDPRASQMSLEDLSALDGALEDAHYANTLVSRQSSIMMRQQHQHRPVPRRSQQQPRSSYMPTGRVGPDNYTVIWVSGECGISLRNFSRKDNKVGAQIAVLQHADGVTTGISNCRLGDQLVSVNGDKVDSLRFREIVEKLKTTRRPISLGFRTNANVQTSPRAASSPPTTFSNSTGGSRSSSFFSRDSKRKQKTGSGQSSIEDRHSVSGGSHPKTNGYFDEDESSDVVHEIIDHPGYADLASSQLTRSSSGEAAADRGTSTSMQSSSSTLSDDVEVWCREQEEMHSDIIVLLTETVMRCEKLQQENMDQLQNLMQLSANSPRPSDRSSAASSYTGTEHAGKADNEDDVLDTDTVVSAAASTTSPGA